MTKDGNTTQIIRGRLRVTSGRNKHEENEVSLGSGTSQDVDNIRKAGEELLKGNYIRAKSIYTNLLKKYLRADNKLSATLFTLIDISSRNSIISNKLKEKFEEAGGFAKTSNLLTRKELREYLEAMFCFMCYGEASLPEISGPSVGLFEETLELLEAEGLPDQDRTKLAKQFVRMVEEHRQQQSAPHLSADSKAPTWQHRVELELERQPHNPRGRKRKEPPPTPEEVREARRLLQWQSRHKDTPLAPEVIRKANRDVRWADRQRQREKQRSAESPV